MKVDSAILNAEKEGNHVRKKLPRSKSYRTQVPKGVLSSFMGKRRLGPRRSDMSS